MKAGRGGAPLHALLPERVYEDGRFLSDRAVLVDPATGRISDVVPADSVGGGESAGGASPESIVTVPLPGRALLPGMVNAHSHSFQRLIRGHTQWRPVTVARADFWSWRRAMYDAALRLTPETLHDVAHFCFIEMLRAGYTAVGEFHYLQRAPDGSAYGDPNELAGAVIAAARAAGIRICLLNVCYATGSIGEPLGREQRRFATPALDDYLAATAALRATSRDARTVTVGAAPHSVRAVPRDWLLPIHEWATEHDVPFHMHVAEQPAEVEASVAAWGMRPVELLAACGVVDARLTAVHATHLIPDEVALLGGAAATICACPTTERDLGDGMLQAQALSAAGAEIAIGSDSQTIIDPFEELRLVEYNERLRTLQRVVLGQAAEQAFHTAPAVLRMGGAGGAAALRFAGGEIRGGAVADLVAVDLGHRALAGWSADSLAAAIALSAPADVVSDVWVDARQVVTGRQHAGEAAAQVAFEKVAAA